MGKDLCVLTYASPSDELKGKARRYLLEIRPNVFVGSVSTRVRDGIWKSVSESKTQALLIHSSSNEQGFDLKVSGEDQTAAVGLADFCGGSFPALEKRPLALSDLYAKPDEKLVDHAMDAGAIARALLTEGRGKRLVDAMSERFSIDREELVSSICFLCAVHDVGKAHPGFQKSLMEKTPELAGTFAKLVAAGMIVAEDDSVRHERYSREIVQAHLEGSGFEGECAKDFAYAIAYHHQGKASDKKIFEPVERAGASGERWSEWARVQGELIAKVAKEFPFSQKMAEVFDKWGSDGFIYMIVSVMVNSDWIASGEKWRSLVSKRSRAASEYASEFVRENGLGYEPLKKKAEKLKWSDAFDFPKNEMQEALSNADLEGADLILLEYPCGYGKTAAALLAAFRTGRDQSGIYCASPTTTTAKAQARAMRKLAERIRLGMVVPELDSSMVWSDNDMEKIPKDMWVCRTRHQFLYPFAVGTIDQALKCVVSYRYSCMGLLGLSDKVLVVDEVHAYNAFMIAELVRLIEWCRFLHVPVVLLSATLPTKVKEKLFKAAGVPLSKQDVKTAYPLISVVKEKALIQIETKAKGKAFPIRVEHADSAVDRMYEIATSYKSGCLALIAPTVDSAFELYDRVRGSVSDCEVLLYHSRDTVAHKEVKAEGLLSLLGKDRSRRPKKLIVVATSIIEQSLDVSFDDMATALAPIDLMVQRLGRVLRHEAEGEFLKAVSSRVPLTVIVPNEYGSLARIYDEGILNRTAAVLSKVSAIDTILDVRGFVDEVYGKDYEIPKDASSEAYGGRNCIGDPFGKTSTIANGSEASYEKFRAVVPKTRDEKYPTISIAILPEAPKEIAYSDAARIMRESTVSVPLYKIVDGDGRPLFEEWDGDAECLGGTRVFVGGESLTVRGRNGKEMQLSENGLRFFDNGV